MSPKSKIHWSIPCTIIAALSSAILFAVGHHTFYQSRAGHVALDVDFGVAISPQQFNVAVGTAFALLVKSMLGIAVTTSHMQILWRTVNRQEHGLLLQYIDTAYSMPRDLLSLLKACFVWWRSLMLPIALIFWLIPLASVFTTGTLSVQSLPRPQQPDLLTPVPQFDFLNPNFANLLYQGETQSPATANGSVLNYNGPSQPLLRIAAATAAQGSILPIEPPNVNASWSLAFWGPSLQCTNVSESMRRDIVSNYAIQLKAEDDNRGSGSEHSYFTWEASEIVKDTSVNELVAKSRPSLLLTGKFPLPFQNATTENGDYTRRLEYQSGWGTFPIPGWRILNPVPTLFVAINQLAWMEQQAGSSHNITVTRCDLFNSSYRANFNYTNGAQRITTVITQTAEVDDPVMSGLPVAFPTGPTANWNSALPEDLLSDLDAGFGPTQTRYLQSRVRAMSYQAIQQAFDNLFLGTMDAEEGEGDASTSVANTVIMETSEMRGVDNQASIIPLFQRSPVFSSRDATSSLGSRGALATVLEQLFLNMTISILSESFFQPNFSQPSAPSNLTHVVLTTYENVYVYDASTLWIAYGLAIFFTLFASIAGLIMLWSSGVGYDGNFSTIFRFSRQALVCDKHGRPYDFASKGGDDNSVPMSTELMKAKVLLRGKQESTIDDRNTELKDRNLLVEAQEDQSGHSLLRSSQEEQGRVRCASGDS